MYHIDTNLTKQKLMAEEEKTDKVARPIRWANLRADEAQRVISNRAAESKNVGFSFHAFDRVQERSITQVDALTILRQ